MIEKIIGKRNSLQRKLMKEFVIVFIILVIVTFSIFYVSVKRAIEAKFEELYSENETIEESDLQEIIGRSIIISVSSFLIFTVVIMRYSAKKILQPIKQINKATKKVARGDFDIELETEREDEIGKLTYNFNVMVKDLNKIEILQKDFINNVSHEMKTPVSSIKGFAQLLKSEDLTEEEKREYIDIIVEESDRLLNISTNILKLSKLQNREKVTNVTQVEIDEQIKKVINILENKWSSKKITIVTDLPKTIVYGDEELLYQMWVNIIDNGIKFTDEEGHIYISIKRNKDNAEVSIRDDGIGMTEEDKKKIFERFYQADQSHFSEGSGLGLSIVKRILNLVGGEIKIETKKGKGSNFIIKLPYDQREIDNKITIK